jgi:Plasmid pRiA4b ORF-3-like protein
MKIDLNRLDAIEDDPDTFIEALDDYVEESIDEFVETKEGKAYLAAYPAMEEFVGSWIYQLLYLGYSYESVTLPNMTKVHVEEIVTKLFPRKILLGSPDEADTAIPELLAFWQFLDRVYQHSHAPQIVTLLQQLQPKFNAIMNDASNFGIGKSFIAQGMNAGFDLTTHEGLEAYRSQYNQTDRSSSSPNFNSLLENFGIKAGGETENFVTALMSAIPKQSESKLPPEIPPLRLLQQEFQTSQWQSSKHTSTDLSAAARKLLHAQTLTAASPGTILTDFQTLLDFIGDKGTAVSVTNHLLPLKSLAEINQQLSEPITLDLKRPVQKSYPPIDGLYLLLRASGLGRISAKGKKYFLTLDPTLLAIWDSLNPTERYCTLLETWLIRAHSEIIGENDPLNLGSKCFQFWPAIPVTGINIANYEEQSRLAYYPELRNIALFAMFGFIELTTVKPAKDKGWRIKLVEKLPFGDAMMTLLYGVFSSVRMWWPSENDPDLPLAELQPTLQPYFPEWQNVLGFPKHEFNSGVYIFKIYLLKCWRRIAISSNLTLQDLSLAILESVDFDNDHLDKFIYENRFGRSMEVYHPFCQNDPKTDTVQIGDLTLPVGSVIKYIFDFGDWWEFKIELEQIQSDDTRVDRVEIVEHSGDAPEQYPQWEDEEWIGE